MKKYKCHHCYRWFDPANGWVFFLNSKVFFCGSECFDKWFTGWGVTQEGKEKAQGKLVEYIQRSDTKK
jgi:hypothetical protein